ncbi:hypothetical protein [Carboxylicivirga sp. M1479]|uniref:hypothetical protein n=1 Tax=Carboxylicivirga sp. M1479 TaxID=2594476 RepID=UPI001177DE8C|nr:hypothetical protein [Carboxylicivirga sp. M1479]TRX71760.1 hypothetical protein FNN09_03835 [Carboxylicivirga sp. M1479]
MNIKILKEYILTEVTILSKAILQLMLLGSRICFCGADQSFTQSRVPKNYPDNGRQLEPLLVAVERTQNYSMFN